MKRFRVKQINPMSGRIEWIDVMGYRWGVNEGVLTILGEGGPVMTFRDWLSIRDVTEDPSFREDRPGSADLPG